MLRSALTVEEWLDVRYGATQVETNIVSGALDFSKKTVGSCMTSIQDAFMLDSKASLPSTDTSCRRVSTKNLSFPINCPCIMRGKTDGRGSSTRRTCRVAHSCRIQVCSTSLRILWASLLTVCLVRCRVVEEKLTFEVIYKIFLQGHSRVPVYEVKT
jgi:hypothetical protein